MSSVGIVLAALRGVLPGIGLDAPAFDVLEILDEAPRRTRRNDHDTLEHLRDEGLVETVDLGDDERGLTLTREGRDLFYSHAMDRDDEPAG